MITLTEARVTRYKCIEDSSSVPIAKDVTILVGKNESGKTTLLEALHKALPLGNAKFDFVLDFPRKDYVRYRPQYNAKSFPGVVGLTFRIGNEVAARINAGVFGDAPVVQPGHTFSRASDYGNGTAVDLNLDGTGAVDALKARLGGVEHADEVFAEAERLEDVLERIEAKHLPPANALAVFAKEWRERAAKALPGWDALDWHVWHTYVEDSLPRFLYFDDYRLLAGKVNLESLNQRKINKHLSGADETALGLFELAGIDLQELMSDEGYETSRAKLEAIGLTITQQVFEYWTQNPDLAVEFDIKVDPKDHPPFNSGKNLYIRVKDLRHGVTVPFDLRSKGFIWFFSFVVWFSAVKNRAGTDKDLILLLDEPGLSLHALAQRDFLSYIDTLAKSHQIIYTTHSPFMVESDHLERVRVVEDRPDEGTKVTAQLSGASDDSLFPLQAALGYSIAQNLFIANKNILIEGAADLILLLHMSAMLEQRGKGGLAEGVFVPVGGLDKLATFLALLGANGLTLVVLHDRDSGPHGSVEDLIHQNLIERKRVLDFSMFRTQENVEADIEDLFPVPLYVDAFNTAYGKELKGAALRAAELGQHPRIVERINQWLKGKGLTLLKDGGFNHYRVAQALVPRLTDATLSLADLEPFQKLFARVNAALG